MKVVFDTNRGVGASTAAAVMGLSPWRDPMDVWLEKTLHPHFTPKAQTPAMKWGNIMEPVLRDAYTADTGISVLPGPEYGTEPMWAANGIQYVHVDGYAMGPAGAAGIWEGKTASNPDDWADGVPIFYQVQCQQGMAITELPWCDVSVLIGGNDFRTYRLESDLGMQFEIEEAVLRFWQAVTNKVPPGPATPLILYPKQDDSLPLVAADDALNLAAKTLLEIKRRGKANLEGVDALVEQIQTAVGLAPGADGDGWYLIWKEAAAPKSIGWEAVATSLWNTLECLRRNMGYGVREIEPEVAQYLDRTLFNTLQGMYTVTGKPTRPFLLKDGVRK